MRTIDLSLMLLRISAASLVLATPIAHSQANPAQSSAPSPTPPAPPAAATAPATAQPPIKFDVVVFKLCDEIDRYHPDVIAPSAGDSISNHCQTVTHFLELAFGSTGAPYILKGEPPWVDTEAYDF